MRKLTIVLALLIFSTPAWGQKVTIKKMLEIYDLAPPEGKQKINNMFMHQEIGMSWSNVYQASTGGIALYCKPKNLRLTREQAFQIFRDEVEREKRTNELTMASGVYLLGGLIKTFPCK